MLDALSRVTLLKLLGWSTRYTTNLGRAEDCAAALLLATSAMVVVTALGPFAPLILDAVLRAFFQVA